MTGKLTYEEMAGKLENETLARRRAEEALRESEEKYKRFQEKAKKAEEIFHFLIRSSADAVIIYDVEGKARYVSPAFTRIFGWTLEEVEGKRIPFLSDSERNETLSEITSLIEDGVACHGFETRSYTKSGALLDVSISASRYYDHEEKPAGMLVVLWDITHARKLQAQLQHAQKMESIGTIASGVAHNFRNVLAGISVNRQLIELKYQDDDTLMQIAERISHSVEKGARLVDELMQFSRKEKKKEFKLLHPARLLREAHDSIAKCCDKTIAIRVDVPELPCVLGDLSSLRQVFMNLCTNARDAMPKGGQLSIIARQKGDDVEVSISDTGLGIDKETQGRCFDPFFTTKEVDKGTGLGLSTAYGIVKEHGGHIRVYSELNRGTTFRVSLPMAPSGG